MNTNSIIDWFATGSHNLCLTAGVSLLVSGCVSLGLAVFQLAFGIVPQQIAFRALLQVYLILMGWRLIHFQPVVTFTPIVLFTTCAITTATIGLIIASGELTVILWTQPLVMRIVIYGVLLAFGMFFSPHKCTIAVIKPD